MKSTILILAVIVVAFSVTVVRSSCVCKQCTCTTDDVCEADKKPKDCQRGRGKIDANTYEADDGEFIYQIQMEPKSGWADAVQKCKDAGFTHLATLDDDAKRLLFMQMIRRSGHKVPNRSPFDPQLWISYNNQNGYGYHWEPSNSTVWQTGWWYPGRPNGDGVCAAIGNQGTYNSVDCGFQTGRLCQKPCNNR